MTPADLKAVDGRELPDELRKLLKPDELLTDSRGVAHRLPRYFFEVPSWANAKDVFIAPHFKLSELMTVDCREADHLLHTFPHYVPCAIALLASVLEHFRREVEAPVFISANGGYRSPAHQLSDGNNLHAWGTAANIYRVGGSYLDDENTIAKYAKIAAALGSAATVKGYVEGDDHLHIDLGFVTVIPRDKAEVE
jgi:hypothetical protein